MATVITAEDLAQRALDVNVVDERQLQAVWSELGSRNVELVDFQQALLRRGLITNYQLDRLLRGLRSGFFYGKYKVQYCVGTGTFARVFRATLPGSDTLYAVKVLRSRFSNPKSDPQNPAIIEAFRREGELGSTLNHVNIVPIIEVFSRGSNHFLVMDFVEGRNLREFYKVRRKFDPMEASHIVSGIMAGLSYAFQHGVTHRDLKMSNILISSDGVSKLVDFGLAGLDADDEESENVNQRTIDYAGLERATGVRRDDTRSDIFFVGCIFYQMLTGVPALAETRDRVQRLAKSRYQDIRPILDVNPKLPYVIAMVANKAIEFDPDRRYQTPGEMLIDLKLAMKRTEEGRDKETSQKELASEEGIDENGQPRKLMVVESDVKMQDLFRDLFKRNGYRVLVSSDPDRTLQRFFNDPRSADIVLFTTAAIGRAAFDVFNQFGRESVTRELPAVLLLDERHQEWELEAHTSDHRRVEKMPIKQRRLREVVLEAARAKATG
jgi:serine/threonine-protein kinase